MIEILGYLGLFFAAMLAGGINSIAGGGTLISFPALVAFGVPTINANATNTSALWPGSVSGAIGYARDTARDRDYSGVIARSVFCDEAIPAQQFRNDNVGDCFAKIARNDISG